MTKYGVMFFENYLPIIIAIRQSTYGPMGKVQISESEKSMMTSFREFYERMGFEKHPFFDRTAEKEDTSNLFISPPDYSVLKDVFDSEGTSIISGNRGTGKTIILLDIQAKASLKRIVSYIGNYESIPLANNILDFYSLILQSIIIQSEAEVRSKFIVPLLDFLEYPSELRVEEYPVYGFEGGKKLPTKNADFIMFSNKDFGIHRTFTQKNIDWVHDHSLLIVEAEKPKEMLPVLGQPVYYTIWTKDDMDNNIETNIINMAEIFSKGQNK